MCNNSFPFNPMIKAVQTILLITAVSIQAVAFSTTAEARDKERPEHIPTEKVVEFTLLNLKESLDEINYENYQLEIKNSTLRKDINYLVRVLESLAVQKSQLSGQPLSFYYPKDQASPSGLIDLEDRKLRTQDLISHFEADIMKLNEQIKILDRKLDGRDHESKREILLRNKESSEANITRMEQRIKSLEKEAESPLRKIEGLKHMQAELEEELREIQESPYSY